MCQEFDITQFVTSQEDMQKLIDNQNYVIQKAFKTCWSKQLRSFKQIEELQISVRKPQDFKGHRMLIKSSDIS